MFEESCSLKMSNSTTLLVKHIPSVISESDQEELFKLFGAKKIRCMPKKGKLKCMTFVTFQNHENAKSALVKLHQLEVLGQRLVVEFAKRQYEVDFPKESDYPTFKSKRNDEVKLTKISDKEQLRLEADEFSKKIHGISSALSLDYLPSPYLKYNYPLPNASIIANISHALIAVPKFYSQVLHLMNKMNLPAPFGPITPTPPFPLNHAPFMDNHRNDYQDNAFCDKLEVENMDTDTDESEIESEEDSEKTINVKQGDASKQIKRPFHKVKMISKKPKLQQLLPQSVGTSKSSDAHTEPADVFETPMQLENQRKIQFNIKPNLEFDDLKTSTMQENKIESGFGIIGTSKVNETPLVADNENQDNESDVSAFISSNELRKKRISKREMKSLPVFKNYSPGEPTVRLYVKNLAKQVEEKDLKFIFGRFIDWDSEIDKNMFDIRLMKEGRMKGQAFVTLATERQAIEAVNETNGFLLHTKPLVVQFARSAKAKENALKERKTHVTNK